MCERDGSESDGGTGEREKREIGEVEIGERGRKSVERQRDRKREG